MLAEHPRPPCPPSSTVEGDDKLCTACSLSFSRIARCFPAAHFALSCPDKSIRFLFGRREALEERQQRVI